jgi:hypothetical protein
MIDETWLSSLRFESLNGIRVVGLLGVGSEKVTLEAVAPDGRQLAMQTYKHHLGYHIKEIPPTFCHDCQYDRARLNRKLEQIVGMPGVDEMISDWDRLYSAIVKMIIDKGVEPLLLLPLADPSAALLTDSLPLLVGSSPVRRRLTEFAELGESGELFVRVNGPNFPIDEMRPTLVRSAKAALARLDSLTEAADIESNPLFIWGGAAMEEFFRGQDMRIVGKDITARFGSLSRSRDAYRLINEADALANVFAFFFTSDRDLAAIVRFTTLCAHAGLVFDVSNRSGQVVASGMSMLTDS